MSSPLSHPARRGRKPTNKPKPYDQHQKETIAVDNTWNQAVDQSGWDVEDTSYLDKKSTEHQDRVDGLDSLIPFWLEGVNAAERGEEVLKMGEFYDRLDKREAEMRDAWNNGKKDETGWGSNAQNWGASADAHAWGAFTGSCDHNGWDQPADATGWNQPPEASPWDKSKDVRGANPTTQRWRGGHRRHTKAANGLMSNPALPENV